MKQLVVLGMISSTVVGILDAGYLTWEKIQGVLPTCHEFFKCGQVLSSPWSNVGPVPLSAIGLLFYLSFFSAAIAAYLKYDSWAVARKSWRLSVGLVLLGLVGSAFSIYLVVIMGLVIKAWCFYCLLSAFNCQILLVLSLLYRYFENKEATL